jgi:hypothetical protein
MVQQVNARHYVRRTYFTKIYFSRKGYAFNKNILVSSKKFSGDKDIEPSANLHQKDLYLCRFNLFTVVEVFINVCRRI